MGTHRNQATHWEGQRTPVQFAARFQLATPSKPLPHLPTETSVSSWALVKRFVISVAITPARHLLFSSPQTIL
ncbi:hypothetical protein CGRA01v4_06742 [Colletotrichum graminicola]|nr:hypothetical protein CGRA01v4_06742 [Colletotrichum graminicola]